MILLPDQFDELFSQAIQDFWSARAVGDAQQEGDRAKVVGGKNLDGFFNLVQWLVTAVGPPGAVIHTHKTDLPGYFRITKDWDIVITHDLSLLCALEFKSLPVSIGKNINNRMEEALGSALDFYVANREGYYHRQRHRSAALHADNKINPFIGYLMILGDSDESQKLIQSKQSHYKIDPNHIRTSYQDRYKIFCERLMNENLYDVAALCISKHDVDLNTSTHRHLSQITSARHLFASLSAHLITYQEIINI